MKMKITLALLTSAACVSSSAAQITVVDSYEHTLNTAITGTIVNDPGGSTKTITNTTVGALVASGSDKLVVGVNSRSNIPFTVTYGGVAMTEAVSQASTINSGFAAIFYLDNPAVDGDFVFSSPGSNNFDRANIHAWVLSGTAAGGAAEVLTDTATGSSNPIDLSLTTGASGGFVIGSIGANGGTPTTTFAPDSGTDFLYAYANANSNAYAAWLTDTSNTFSMLRTNTTNTAGGNGAGVMANFAPAAEAVPESVSLAGFAYDPADGNSSVSIKGIPYTRYKLVEAADLDFSAPDQDPIPLDGATVGTLDAGGVITDSNGIATVHFQLGTRPATFFRAEGF